MESYQVLTSSLSTLFKPHLKPSTHAVIACPSYLFLFKPTRISFSVTGNQRFLVPLWLRGKKERIMRLIPHSPSKLRSEELTPQIGAFPFTILPFSYPRLPRGSRPSPLSPSFRMSSLSIFLLLIFLQCASVLGFLRV